MPNRKEWRKTHRCQPRGMELPSSTSLRRKIPSPIKMKSFRYKTNHGCHAIFVPVCFKLPLTENNWNIPKPRHLLPFLWTMGSSFDNPGTHWLTSGPGNCYWWTSNQMSYTEVVTGGGMGGIYMPKHEVESAKISLWSVFLRLDIKPRQTACHLSFTSENQGLTSVLVTSFCLVALSWRVPSSFSTSGSSIMKPSTSHQFSGCLSVFWFRF